MQRTKLFANFTNKLWLIVRRSLLVRLLANFGEQANFVACLFAIFWRNLFAMLAIFGGFTSSLHVHTSNYFLNIFRREIISTNIFVLSVTTSAFFIEALTSIFIWCIGVLRQDVQQLPGQPQHRRLRRHCRGPRYGQLHHLRNWDMGKVLKE